MRVADLLHAKQNQFLQERARLRTDSGELCNVSGELGNVCTDSAELAAAATWSYMAF